MTLLVRVFYILARILDHSLGAVHGVVMGVAGCVVFWMAASGMQYVCGRGFDSLARNAAGWFVAWCVLLGLAHSVMYLAARIQRAWTGARTDPPEVTPRMPDGVRAFLLRGVLKPGVVCSLVAAVGEVYQRFCEHVTLSDERGPFGASRFSWFPPADGIDWFRVELIAAGAGFGVTIVVFFCLFYGAVGFSRVWLFTDTIDWELRYSSGRYGAALLATSLPVGGLAGVLYYRQLSAW